MAARSAPPFPPDALLVRGRATITELTGVAEEYAAAARRHLGAAAGSTLIASSDRPGTRIARIAVRPTWVGLLDFRTRLPSAQGRIENET